MADNAEQFLGIMKGEFLSRAQRIKQALDDREVYKKFSLVRQKYDEQYWYCLNFLADRYSLTMEEGEEIYGRLSRRQPWEGGET